MTGDLLVNFADVGPFSCAFSSCGYGFCADFFYDGLMNLADVGIFAVHLLHSC